MAMNVDVYDSYALADDGHRMHFDVLLPASRDARDEGKAADVARVWLRSIGMDPDRMRLEQCRYCHSETVRPEVSARLAKQGYFILPMEGCPSENL